MIWRGPFDARWLRRWTIALGIATLVVFALPALTVLALISIVGIPLGIVAMATPFVFSVVALAYLTQKLHGRDGPLGVAASIVAALILMAAAAQLANSKLDRRADEFLAQDHDELARPLAVRSIALTTLNSITSSKTESRCEELCQRLLLSGAVERVLVVNMKRLGKEDGYGEDWASPWRSDAPALAYFLEQRESCPPAHVAGRGGSNPVDDAKPDETMRLGIASGRCLIEEVRTLADAEAVVATGTVQRGLSDFGAGLSFFADTVTAWRASVHRNEGGSFVERYRWTGVSILHHPFVPVPTLVGGHELNMHAGFARNRETRNLRGFAENGSVDTIRFVRDELGLNVALPPAPTASERSELIARGLDAAGPLQSGLQQVIEDFFESLRDPAGPEPELDEATRRLAMRALADPRVAAPRLTWVLVRGSRKAGDAVNAEIAAVLFAKLDVTDPAARENHPSYLGWPISYVATAIGMLPPTAVLPYRAKLEALARDPMLRRRTHAALAQLSSFGADAVPTLVFLVETSLRLRQEMMTARDSSSRQRDPEGWMDPYHTGLSALCRIGSDASAALPPLMKHLREGAFPMLGGSNDEILLGTLVRIGADPAELRPLFVREKTMSDGVFDRVVKNARTRSDCRF